MDSTQRQTQQLFPRFAVLALAPGETGERYVIFDRHTARITDGVYGLLEMALEVAAYTEAGGRPAEDMTPTAEALGLLFPTPTQGEQEQA